MKVRPATLADLPRIEQLVVELYGTLGVTTIPPQWPADLRDAFSSRLGGDLNAFLTETDIPIAIAVGVIDQRLPSPRRPSGRIGYVEWVATDARYRRQGAARLALQALLSWFDQENVPTVDIHSSQTAMALYTDLGFRPPRGTALRRE